MAPCADPSCISNVRFPLPGSSNRDSVYTSPATWRNHALESYWGAGIEAIHLNGRTPDRDDSDLGTATPRNDARKLITQEQSGRHRKRLGNMNVGHRS